MTRSELIRRLDRVTADDVKVCLGAFFTSDPPADEMFDVVDTVTRMGQGFTRLMEQPAPEATTAAAPEAAAEPVAVTTQTTETKEPAEVAAASEATEAKGSES